jgi:hypothetical protein
MIIIFINFKKMTKEVPYHDWFDWGNLWKIEIKKNIFENLSKLKQELELMKIALWFDVVWELQELYDNFIEFLLENNFAYREGGFLTINIEEIQKKWIDKILNFHKKVLLFYNTKIIKSVFYNDKLNKDSNSYILEIKKEMDKRLDVILNTLSEIEYLYSNMYNEK